VVADGWGSLLAPLAVQIGFVLGAFAIAVTGLADSVASRKLFAVAAVAGALSNAAVVFITVDTVPLAYVLRAATGMALGVLVGALTIGTSGRLFASALVMYDRATESLWTHFDGRAVVGVLTGEQLEAIASALMAWEDFAAAYPEGLVLDWNATGFRRDYGSNPYVGYDDADTEPFLFRGPLDDRARGSSRAEFHRRIFAGQEHLTRAVPSECVLEKVSGGADVGMD